MRTFLLALVLAAPAALAQEARIPPGVAVALSDGSVLVSSGLDDVLQVNTPYGEQKVPIRQIRMARRLPTGSVVLQAQGMSITGELAQKEIELHTGIGPMRVATNDLRMISVPNGPGYVQDEAAVAAWWFGDAADGACRDLVKGRPFALADYERVEDAAGLSAIVARSQTALATVPSDADLDIGEGDYTLEIRFRVSRQPRQNVVLLEKGTTASGAQEFNLCACTNGVISAYAARTGQSLQTPNNCYRRDVWNTVTFVQRAQPPGCALYLNGKLCASGAFPIPIGAAAGMEWTIGMNPRMGGGCEPPEAVQFVRFSRKARTQEEIEQLEKGWDASGCQGGPLPGVVLRDGSFLRGDVACSAVFRTRFGSLKISEKAGTVRLFRMRQTDLEKERVGLPDLITQLGSSQIKDREDAFNRLLARGEIAMPELRRLPASPDAEVRSRVAEAIKKMEETGVARRPACDVLQLGGLSLQGWVDVDPVVVNTRRGKIQLSPSKVAEIRFGRRDPRPRPLLRLFSGEALEFEPGEHSTLGIDTGFGVMSIPAEELKELAYGAETRTWLMVTERMTATGKISGALTIETPLGPLVVPASDLKELKPAAAAPATPFATDQ